MLRQRQLSIFLVLASLVAAGCATRARVGARAEARVSVPRSVTVQVAPPAVEAQATARPAQPASGAAWVEGHYKWDGQWVWIDGHWETGHRGEVWVAPVAHQDGDSVTYYPGYWCPEGAEPAPVYRRPSRVRVTARVSVGASAGTSGGEARPVGNGRTADPGGAVTVTARPAGSGSTTARPAGGASASGTATVSANRNPNPSRAQGNGAVVARPAGNANGRGTGTVAANRNPNPQRAQGNGAVVARPAGNANGSGTGTVAANRNPNPARARGDGAAVARPNQPATVEDSGRGRNARIVNPAPPTSHGQTNAGQRPNSGQQAPTRELSCSLQDAQAPRGGIFVLSGVFGSAATVQVGGVTAQVVSRTSTRIQARVPGSSGGGAVRVREGDRTAACGTLSVGR